MPEKNYRILIADDDDNILELVKIYMETEGFQVVCARDGQEALEKIQQSRPHLIILDIMMPRLDGREVCSELRSRGDKTPIIILTARGDDYDKILGLELGADDYVTKPFNPRELTARVKAVLRRLNNDVALPRLIIFPGLEIDPEQHRVIVGDKEILLTRTEMDLLCMLAEQPNRVFTRENLLLTVWGYEYPEDLRTVDTHIKRLRKKLGQGKEEPAPDTDDDNRDGLPVNKLNGQGEQLWEIKTVWGVGYKLEVKR